MRPINPDSTPPGPRAGNGKAQIAHCMYACMPQAMGLQVVVS